jgi:hypothetical protein
MASNLKRGQGTSWFVAPQKKKRKKKKKKKKISFCKI